MERPLYRATQVTLYISLRTAKCLFHSPQEVFVGKGPQGELPQGNIVPLTSDKEEREKTKEIKHLFFWAGEEVCYSLRVLKHRHTSFLKALAGDLELC